jgi:phenylacetic acid degradation operon negative regulatory protein
MLRPVVTAKTAVSRSKRAQAAEPSGDEKGAGSRLLGGGHLHSARSALLSLVSKFVYPDPVPVPTQAFVAGLDLLGFNEKAARQALNRARDAGWLESRKSGRRSLWELSPQGHELMNEGSSRLAALSESRSGWDGRVLFVNISVPENARHVRHTLRTRLSWLGFTTIATGLWASTNLSAEAPARDLLAELGLPAYSFAGTAGGIGDLADVIREAWHLDELAAEYRSFIAEFEPLRPVTADEYFICLTQLVHQWRRFPFIDPALPDALLPSPWIGRRAATLAQTMSQLWNSVASERWKALAQEANDRA